MIKITIFWENLKTPCFLILFFFKTPKNWPFWEKIFIFSFLQFKPIFSRTTFLFFWIMPFFAEIPFFGWKKHHFWEKIFFLPYLACILIKNEILWKTKKWYVKICLKIAKIKEKIFFNKKVEIFSKNNDFYQYLVPYLDSLGNCTSFICMHVYTLEQYLKSYATKHFRSNRMWSAPLKS